MIGSANISDLQDKNDRIIAKLARIATNDTVFGGAKALVLAKRLDSLGSQIDAGYIVSDVYSASIGRALPQYRPCFCPECGQAILGEDTALNCCLGQYEEDYDNED